MTTELVDGISVIGLRTAFASTTLMVTPPRVITDVMAVVAGACAVITGAGAAKLMEVVIAFIFPSAVLLE